LRLAGTLGPRLDRYVQEIVERNPAPPREFSVMRILSQVFSQARSVAWTLVGLVALAIGVGFQFAKGQRWLGISAGVALGIFGVFMLSAPWTALFSLVRALRGGVLAKAEVLDVRFVSPHEARIRAQSHREPSTLEAAKNGFAEGTCLITDAQDPFREKFWIDTPWASELRAGSYIQVLLPRGRAKWSWKIRLLDSRETL
jgi:hypothetical protein